MFLGVKLKLTQISSKFLRFFGVVKVEKEAILVVPYKCLQLLHRTISLLQIIGAQFRRTKNKLFSFGGVASFYDHYMGVQDKKKSSFTRTASTLY